MLDKNGWGLKEMLILVGILTLFLLIAIYNIYKLYDNIGKEVNYNYYHNLEKKLEKQAYIYLDQYYDENLTSDEVIITRNILKVYDLDITLNDPNGNTCEGYVKASKTHGKENIKGYIKCSNYTTDNY